LSAFVTKVNEHGQCPGCGAGRGKPHFERCLAGAAAASERLISRREISGITAYAIGIFPLDVVRRSTIRMMLPRGRTGAAQRARSGKGHRNVISGKFGDELRQLEGRGWIGRGEEHVAVVARASLLGYARSQLRHSADLIAALHESVAAVAAGLPEETTAAGRAQRQAELRALQQLMEQAPGTGPHSGRGHVDLVHKPRMI